MSKEGKNPTEISKILNRTRPWVYKWTERATSGEPEWYLDASKSPHKKPNKVNNETEQAIVESRRKLVRHDTPETKYSYCGAIAIHQELDKLGYKEKPSITTINRILKRNDLIENEPKNEKTNKSNKYYPEIRAQHPGHIHQLDMVTPRYISGYGKIISINRIDVCTNRANLDQYISKGAENVISFAVADWREYGIPIYLQMDNEAAFRGGLYHPRTFGSLTRFCLNFGVQIIFIPFKEPWRNGYIESFNSRFDRMLWRSQKFIDLIHIKTESLKFRDKHNDYQEYKKDTFNKQYTAGYSLKFLPKNFKYDTSKNLPITKGQIHFIRLIDEHGYTNILNEPFYVDKCLSFEYVWFTINTEQQLLYMYYKALEEAPRELIKTVPYKLREPVLDRIPIKKFY